jgi:hypothetical protein
MSELPVWRSRGCEDEYKQIAHAFDTLLRPHLDLERLKTAVPAARFDKVAD